MRVTVSVCFPPGVDPDEPSPLSFPYSFLKESTAILEG